MNNAPSSAGLKRLYFLVDFDNLRRFSRGKSLVAIVQHLVAKTPVEFTKNCSQIDFRLYGGWRSGSSTTVSAQTLAIEIAKSFPIGITQHLDDGTQTQCRITAALAYAPLFLPSTAIDDTYIRGRSSRRIYAEPRPWSSCANEPTCSLNALESLLSNDVCPNQICSVTPDQIFRQDEQKQVDTLLVADLAHLAYSKAASYVVAVSSDADIWPGILLSLSQGLAVLHMQTTPGVTTPRTLTATLGALRKHYQTTSV